MITIAQIGCGYWGPNLLRNFVANRDCRVKWVCELSEDRRNFVRSLYPAVGLTTSLDEVLADPEVDAVVIAVPVAHHYAFAMRALEAGKHILVEKPMATTVAEVADIRELARRRGLTAMVGHTFLYNASVRYIKKYIDSGELGEVRYIYSQRLNLGRIRNDVDALWNFAPHDVSIIQYLLGDPEPAAVERHGMDFLQPGVQDVVFLNIRYPSKVMAQVHVSWLDPQKVRRMTIVGSRRMIVYDDMAEAKVAIYDKGIDRRAVLGENMDYDDPGLFSFDHRSGDILLPKISGEEPLKAEVAHFVQCIAGNGACMTGADHALGVVRILSSAGPA